MTHDLQALTTTTPLPITDIARQAGVHEDDLEQYGRFKAKVSLRATQRGDAIGRYIDVSAITPTPFGEGKTVVSIGLAEALHTLGKKSFVCLRQPSMGPTFGINGGAAGGGRASLLPREEVNLHLTGDIHAVGAAHNLLAAAVDAHLFHGNALGIDPATIMIRRAIDISDRALRHITINAGDKAHPMVRETGFDITVASEVMALLALAADHDDLRARLGRIIVAMDRDGEPVTAERLRVAGAMAALLKDALKPNLVQTIDGSPAFVHAGPFANIAHGNSSIVADAIALRHADYVVTESGFGTDLGMEKFMDIKCRTSGLGPDCVVVVATVRALKMHGGAGTVTAGKPIPATIRGENHDALRAGCRNLAKHVSNVRTFGVPAVVAINRFPGDSDAEVTIVREEARRAGAADAAVVDVFLRGGEGGVELADAVMRACEHEKAFRFLYPDAMPIADKMNVIARTMYGADGVDLSDTAAAKIELFTRLGYANLPVCMAKTNASLSHDPKLLNAPSGFRVPVRDIRASVGAGFLYALCGDIMTMPGLPSRPAFEKIDVVDEEIVGMI